MPLGTALPEGMHAGFLGTLSCLGGRGPWLSWLSWPFPQGPWHWFQDAPWPPCSCLATYGACRRPAQSLSRDPGLVGPPNTNPWKGLSLSENVGGTTCVCVTCEPAVATATVTRTAHLWNTVSGESPGCHSSRSSREPDGDVGVLAASPFAVLAPACCIPHS